MRATNEKGMRKEGFLPSIMRSVRRVCNMAGAAFLPSSILVLALLLACSFACGPPSSQGDGGQGPTGSTGIPELTEEIINERINEAGVREVPEENASGDPIYWNFDEDEPKEIKVVEKQMNGPSATVVLDIKTRSGLRVRNPRQLAGQIRTEWELKTGWVLRRWEIVRTENISMKYKNLPKPPPQNSNR